MRYRISDFPPLTPKNQYMQAIAYDLSKFAHVVKTPAEEPFILKIKLQYPFFVYEIFKSLEILVPR